MSYRMCLRGEFSTTSAPVPCGMGCAEPMALRRELQDLLHLLGAGDRPRIARYPGRAHRLPGDAVEILAADLHLAQAARHAEAADEGVEHVAGILAGMAHRRGDQRLALGVRRFV